jgi:hypothetical protein
MTKKHFIKLAEYLREPDQYCEPFTDRQIEHLANFCHSVNNNFKTDRFIGYIKGENGPSGGKIK